MSRQDHPFYEQHDALLKAIWNLDRSATSPDVKLAKIKEAVNSGCAPSKLLDVLDDKTGQSRAKVPPLIIACFEGDYDVIKYLLDNGADPNQTESEHNLTPIHVLVDGPYKGQTLTEEQRADLIRQMVKKGADVNHPDKHQLAPVHKVALNDRPGCLDALIEAKVDPNVLFMGERALSIAARQNRDKILKKLLDYPQTKTDLTNETGGTVLHFATAGMVDSPTCVELLLKAGLNVNTPDKRGNTPAMVACFFNRPNILKTLIAAKADLTIKNNEGKDAAALAEEREADECKALLQAK
jgi:ankyrin repeat protein